MMKNEKSTLLLSAISAILVPVVRIMLRNGIAFGTFSEIARKVYADVAFEEFKPVDGKKQSVSHVSAITGLTRKEAKRLLETDTAGIAEDNQQYSRAARVISGWINDHEYLNRNGEPRLLPVDLGDPSFASLVKKYSGDVTTQSMLKVLMSAGSVELINDDLRLIASSFVPGNDASEAIAILGDDSSELISTIDYNMTHTRDLKRFQRKVSEHHIPIDEVREFQVLAAKKSQQLLEELDQWLSQIKSKNSAGGAEDTSYVSVGIYFYERSENREPQP